jgi:ABC-type amino acid transport substrate-binding protein
MLKKSLSLLMCVLLVFSIFTVLPEAAKDGVIVYVEGVEVNFPDEKPFDENGMVLVPVRFLAEAMGAEVNWVQEDNRVDISDKAKQKNLQFWVGEKTYKINDEIKQMDTPVKLINGRVMIPIQFAVEGFGSEFGASIEIEWETIKNGMTIRIVPMDTTENRENIIEINLDKNNQNESRLILTKIIDRPNMQKKGNKLEAIKKAGKIIVGTSADYPPYEFYKETNGKHEIVGFDIEIAKEISKDLGVKLEIKDFQFDELMPALQAGEIDFIASGITPTKEREKYFDFTKVYYTAEKGIAVRVLDKEQYGSVESFAGKTVGIQAGMIPEDIVKEQIPNANIKAFEKVSELVAALKDKQIDAFVAEKVIIDAYADQNKEYVVLDIPLDFDKWESAMAIQKGNLDLVDQINKTVDKLIEENKIREFVVNAANKYYEE